MDEATRRLNNWRARHNTPEKVAAEHRKVLLDRVIESITFEGEPIDKTRLRALLTDRQERS